MLPTLAQTSTHRPPEQLPVQQSATPAQVPPVLVQAHLPVESQFPEQQSLLLLQATPFWTQAHLLLVLLQNPTQHWPELVQAPPGVAQAHVPVESQFPEQQSLGLAHVPPLLTQAWQVPLEQKNPAQQSPPLQEAPAEPQQAPLTQILPPVQALPHAAQLVFVPRAVQTPPQQP
jgi:hypothetical protein